MFEIVYHDDGRLTDGRRLDGYTISSPCEPNGSGELKIFNAALQVIKSHASKISPFQLTLSLYRAAARELYFSCSDMPGL